MPPRGGRAARVRRARRRARHDGDGVRRPPAVPRRLGAAPRPHRRLGHAAWTSWTTTSRSSRIWRASTRDDVRIVLGIEADFIPETLEQTAAILEQYPFEYVIGSVHIVGDRFGFDHPEMAGRLAEYGIDRIHLESLELARQAAESRALRRHRPPRPRQASSGRRRTRRPWRPPRPRRCAPWRRPACRSRSTPAACASPSAGRSRRRRCWPRRTRLGIPLVLGSDAHRPGDVGHGFDHAAELARAAGYDRRPAPSATGETRRCRDASPASASPPSSTRTRAAGGTSATCRSSSTPFAASATQVEEMETTEPGDATRLAREAVDRRVRPRLRARRRRHRQRDHQRPRRQRRPAGDHPHRHRQRAGHGARHPARAAGRGQAARGRHGLVDRPRPRRRPLLRAHGRRGHGRRRGRVAATRR